ncbi:MAG: hypothetical protein JM58_13715 [Peptococcaceae bacterium BICA1-8]|nr:MAG: hypothetical protein JM58_13715 [Peptococcaceae bacterium BICA1-8]
MDKNTEIQSQLNEVSKRKKKTDWLGAFLIVSLVVGAVWFFQQPTARADILGNRAPFSLGGGCCNTGQQSQNRNIAATCGQGTSGCGLNTSSAVTADQAVIEKEAVEYYVQNYGGNNVEAVVTDYGCHIQADIYQDGKLLESLGYSGEGQFYSI